MRNIHSSLSNKYPWYQKWHEYPQHAIAHWFFFAFMMVLFSSVFFNVFAGTTRDRIKPVITSFSIPSSYLNLSVPINSFVATDNTSVVSYIVKESSTTPSYRSSLWRTQIPTSYTFSSSGNKTLYAWAKDSSNNVSYASLANINIVTINDVDTIPPSVPTFSIPSTSTSLTVYFNNLSATDNKAVSGYKVTESSVKPLAADSNWNLSFPSYTFSSVGSKTLYAWAKDASGNISNYASASVVVSLPVITSPTPTPTPTPTPIPAPITTGKIYYLSPSGNDTTGAGTISSPWFSLNKVWTVVVPGDLVYLRGGTYAFSTQQRMVGKSGTSGNLIKVWAYPGEIPNLTKSGSYTTNAGIFFKGNYIHLKGLEISGYTQIASGNSSGIRIENSNYNIFELLNIHNNGIGMDVANLGYDEHTTGNLILNSDFHHNQDPLTSGDPYGNGDGIAVEWITHSGDVNTIRGCRSWANSDDGYDFFNNEGKMIVENSLAFMNGYIPGTTTLAGDGNGFKLGKTLSGYGTEVKRILTNNLSFKNRMNGFDLNNGRFRAELYNNTSYLNGNRGFRMADDTYGESLSHIAKNNIGYMNTSLNGEFSPSSIVSNNTFTLSGGVNTSYFVSSGDFLAIDSTGMDGARQSDGSLPNINFLKLASGSDLVNRGVNVGLPYIGTAPDLGYVESSY